MTNRKSQSQSQSQSSSLLMDESPLCVQRSLAVAIGLNEALFLQQCHYWLNPKFNKNFIEGKYWVHKTLQQWGEEFPFWGEKTIRRIISNLENLKIVISHVTSNGFNKTKFFTIDYDALNDHTSSKPAETLGADPCGQNDQIDLPVWADRSGQNDQIDVDNMTISYKEERLLTENTYSLSQGSADLGSLDLPIEKKERENNFDLKEKGDLGKSAMEMLEIWNEILPEKAIHTANDFIKDRLVVAFRDQLKGNLDQWKTVCKNMRGSKFLMGGIESIRMNPSLSWVLDPKEPRVDWILTKNHYTFDDRVMMPSKIMDVETAALMIDRSDESAVAKDLRHVLLNQAPDFYIAYLTKTSLTIDQSCLHIQTATGFAAEKIKDMFATFLTPWLQSTHQLSWRISGDRA